MSRWKWAGVILAGLFGLYCLLGFLVVPGQLKKQLIHQARQQAGVTVSVENVKVNPLALSVTLEQFSSHDQQRRDLLAASRLYANLQLWPLLGKTIRLRQLTLEDPTVNLILSESGEPHWMDSIPPASNEGEAPPEASSATSPWVFQITQTNVSNGLFRFSDLAHPERYETQLEGLNFALSGLSTEAGEPAPVSMAFAHEGRGSVNLDGGFALTPLKFDGQLTITDLALEPSWRYARYLHGLQLASGTLNGSLDIQVDGTNGFELTTRAGKWSLTDARLTLPDDQTLLALASISMTGPDFSLLEQRLEISDLSLADGSINLARTAEGALRLPPALLGESNAGASSPDPDNDPDHDPGSSDPAVDAAEAGPDSQSPAEASSDPMSVVIRGINVSNLPINWQDESVSPAVSQTLDVRELSIADFDLAPGTEFPVTLNALLGTGEINWQGRHILSPLAADGAASVQGFPLAWLTGYIRENLALDVDSGELSVDMAVKLADNLDLNGSVAMAKLATSSAAGDLAGFETLVVDGLAVSLPAGQPADVTIDKIALDQPSFNFAINAEGASNLGLLTASPAETADSGLEGGPDNDQKYDQKKDQDNEGGPESSSETTAGAPSSAETAAIAVALKELVISGGTLKFDDASVDPGFSTSVTDFGGTLNGLNSRVDSPATLDFTGRLEGYADLALTGALNPQEQRTTVTLATKNVDVTFANTYAGKYIGRLVERGRLDIDLGYELNGQSIKGSNKVTLGQLSLGSQVDSDDAVSLPLDLALALLKDTSGNIDLGVPVAGNLDDPEFRVGSVVFKALVNLIVKAAASPFFMIGKLIPGGAEDLQYVSFQPGTGDLDEAALERLTQLSSALAQRPSLRLDIVGLASRDLDLPAMQQTMLEEQLGLIGLDAEARRAALVTAFEAQIGPVPMRADPAAEPADPSGEQEPGVPDMDAIETQLLAAVTVSDDELRALAGARASAIKTALAAADPELTGRAYVLEPRIADLSGGETVTVELVLAPN